MWTALSTKLRDVNLTWMYSQNDRQSEIYLSVCDNTHHGSLTPKGPRELLSNLFNAVMSTASGHPARKCEKLGSLKTEQREKKKIWGEDWETQHSTRKRGGGGGESHFSYEVSQAVHARPSGTGTLTRRWSFKKYIKYNDDIKKFRKHDMFPLQRSTG
jgi:hypothetical protein